jgi:hypothetical protein
VALTAPIGRAVMGYNLKGSLLEVCDCEVLCPCWIGEDPDNGKCQSALAYRFDKGTIDGIDVAGLTLAVACFIPGNVLAGNWRAAVYVDERATEAQLDALLSVYKGEKGGPIADLAKLIGEVVSVERAKILFDVTEGRGTLKIGDSIHAEMEPYRGPTGEPTKLVESIFSTIPGSPAYVAKASIYRSTQPALGIKVDLQNHNAIQGYFAFEG